MREGFPVGSERRRIVLPMLLTEGPWHVAGDPEHLLSENQTFCLKLAKLYFQLPIRGCLG